MSRFRGYCLTVNNPTLEDWGSVTGLYYCFNAKYVIIGEEVGEQGTPHLQCYAYFPNKIDWKTVKKQCPRAKIIIQKGTVLEAYTYCMKDGKFHEFGDRPHQGKRSDIDAIKYDILKGRPIKEISKEYFQLWCQYRRAFDEFRQMHDVNDKVIYIYDPEKFEHLDYLYSLKPVPHFPTYEEILTKATIFKMLFTYKRVAVEYQPWMDDIIDKSNGKYKVEVVDNDDLTYGDLEVISTEISE